MHSSFGSKIAAELVTLLGEDAATGPQVMCLCPFDGCSGNPSARKTLTVNMDEGKYYCFRCQESGHASDIARLLLNRRSIRTALDRHPGANGAKKKDFHLSLVSVDSLPASWRQRVHDDLCTRRVFAPAEIDSMEFCVEGSTPGIWKNRVLIRVDDLFFGKKISALTHYADSPKYLNPPNFRLAEYGYIGCKSAGSQTLILTEGLLDFKSLPPGSALMSPGTSGLFNEMLYTVSRDRNLVVVPDSDLAGVGAFLRGYNKGLFARCQNKVRFAFTYWLNGVRDSDINSTLCADARMTPADLRAAILAHALDLPAALNRIRRDWSVYHTTRGLAVSEYGEKGLIEGRTETTTGATRAESRPKSVGPTTTDAELRWY